VVGGRVGDIRRAQLRGKYLELGVGELVAAAVFVAVAVAVVMPRMVDPRDQLALWSALTPLLMILVQAGVYWLLARSWVELRPMPVKIARVYRALQISDAVLLAAGLVGVLAWWPDHLGSALVVAAIWSFGAVEYVNYFLFRLAFPILRWFTAVRGRRLPQLAQDLRAAKK
jgi:hypothetical protein